MTDNAAKAKREAMLERIRALMAKTTKNGCTEAEAKSAASAVDRLMGQYEINLDELTIKEQTIEERLARDCANHPVQHAAPAIAVFTDCRWWIRGHEHLVFFGFQVDTEIAEYLALLFKRSLDRDSLTFSMFNPEYSRAGAREKREQLVSFKVGMATRLGERLGELKSKRDFTAKATGRDLVLIKTPLITDAFNALNLKWGTSRASGGTVTHAGSFKAGQAAANKVALNAGIAARGSVGGRIR